MIRTVFTLMMVIFFTGLRGQAKVILLDKVTQKPVEGAQISFTSLATEQQTAMISSRSGTVQVDLALPVLIKVSHIAYSFRQDTLRSITQKILLSPSTLSLDEVVVTGQYIPQSAKNSVYKVRTITAERFENQGANTLQDVLANELNVRFSRDNALGTSGLRLQGISGQNVKVLIDGVPMVGRSGVDNEIDIGQINVNSIERVEIVEGPMAVNFGADALAGVINIITKKSGTGKLAANLTLQEETVESSYSLFEEGVHNAGISVNGNINDRFFAQVEGRVNHFGGWTGDETLFDDHNRQWYPKTQYFGGGLMRYNAENFSVHYRLDFLDQTISNLGKINDLDPNTEPFSNDQEFLTTRWMHQVQAEWSPGKWRLNPVVSYTDYERLTENFTTFLTSDLESNRTEVQNTFYNTLFFRNTASTGNSSWGSLQLGLEGTFDKGAGSTLSSGNKYMEDLAVFASAEISINDRISIRPGIRHSYNSIYETVPTPSLNVKYDVNSSTQVRFGYGRGFRVPSLRELYHEFVDASHNITGNPDLTPEYSHNFNADITKQFQSLDLQTSLSGFYNDVDDQITFFTPEQSNAATTYLNITEFQSVGGTLNNTWKHNSLQLSTGFAYIGRYQRLNEDQNNVPAFVFNWELNSNLSYRFSKSNTTLSAFYKYNGPLKDYRMADPDNDGLFTAELQGIEGFHLLDLTVNQSIANSLELTLGARNLFNVTAVDNNFTSAGAHSGGSGSTSVGYGTSFFLRLNYQLKIK